MNIKTNKNKGKSLFDEVLIKIINKTLALLSSFWFSFSISWQASSIYFILRIILEILAALQPIALIFFSKEIINLLVSVIGVGTNLKATIPLFVNLLILSFLLQILGVVLQKVSEICTGIHKDIISNLISLQLMKKAASLDISFFDSPKFFNDLVNARKDSTAIQTLAWFTVSIIRAGVQVITASLVVANLHWFFALSLILLSVPSVIIERRFIKHTYNWARNCAPEERKMNYYQEVLTSKAYAKDVRLFGLFETMVNNYKVLWKKWFSEKFGITMKKGIWATAFSVLPQIGVFGITFYVGLNIIYRRLTIGDFTLYTGIVLQITGGIYMLISSIVQIYDNELRITNYRQFLAWKPILKPGGTLEVVSVPKIEFKGVSFKYPGSDRYVINNLNFNIAAGEKIALVGSNGAGKSTIVKLLLRFYDPVEGQILVNDIDIKEYDVEQYRKIFGVIFQDYTNYAFSLRENIALSDLMSIGDEVRIKDAIKVSGADQMISSWPKGLDTYLTKQFEQDGEELSGGEWQKIALARAFFRQGSFFILDEPSSALDPEAEHMTFKRFIELCQNKGTIFISHRLSSVSMVDRILVLDEGHIIEDGSHHDLMEKGGRYAYLFNLQAERYIATTLLNNYVTLREHSGGGLTGAL